MSKLVLLDTMICLWGLKDQATPGQEHKIPEARRFLDYLDEEGFDVAISSVTLAELLVACSENEREEFARDLEDTLLILSFDTPSAIHVATLFQNWKETKGTISHRQTVKPDCQILGTAIASGASVVYSENTDFPIIAGHRIKVSPIPPADQLELDLT